jgi:hypothetical protein
MVHYLYTIKYIFVVSKINHEAMKTTQKDIPQDIPKFLRKVLQDKRDIKEAIQTGKPLADLQKEKGIHFAKPL